MKESAPTALKLAGVNVKIEESALYDSQSNELAMSAVNNVNPHRQGRFDQAEFQEQVGLSGDARAVNN